MSTTNTAPGTTDLLPAGAPAPSAVAMTGPEAAPDATSVLTTIGAAAAMDSGLARPNGRQDDGPVKMNVKKWGQGVMDAGYTLVPNVLIERQQALGLDPVDLNILLFIIAHWWTADSRAFLSKETIANAVGRSARTVQRRISRMQKDGILDTMKRFTSSGRRTANAFDLSKLACGAAPFAKELLEERKRRAAENKARRLRKRPMRVIRADDEE